MPSFPKEVDKARARREHKKDRGLGWHKQTSICTSCGHGICRCADRKRRAEIEGREFL